MVADHHDRRQRLTVIDMEDLTEFKSSMNEEFLTFSFGNFLVSGAFWLGIERFFTQEKPFSDPLFLACFFAALAGAVAVIIGFRQLSRRSSKIARIIKEAEAGGRYTNATPTPTHQKSYGT